MNTRFRPFFRQILLLAVACLSSGCLAPTKTATLYSLQPMESAPLNRGTSSLAGMVLVMPVRIAPHLQGRTLLYQQATGETRAAASHLWSAALDKQIGQKVTIQLQSLLASNDVALFPGPRYGVSHAQVEIEVHEFSGDGQTFSALATYTLSDPIAKTILARNNFRRNQAIDNPGYSGYVETASRVVADLSREIAAALLATFPPHAKP